VRVSTVPHTGTRWLKLAFDRAGFQTGFYGGEVRFGHLYKLPPGDWVPVRDPIAVMVSNYRDCRSEYWPKKRAMLDACLLALEGFGGRLIPVEDFDWGWVSGWCGRELEPPEERYATPDRFSKAVKARELDWLERNCSEGMEWLRSRELWPGYEVWW
jgi:hypothetical protein